MSGPTGFELGGSAGPVPLSGSPHGAIRPEPRLAGTFPDPAPLTRLALHTVTTKPWYLDTAIEKYAAAGVSGISVWRDTIEGQDDAGLSAVRRHLSDAGLAPVSLVRGGFFASIDSEARAAALEENRKAIREAEALGLPLIVLVCGADPTQPLETSREQIIEALHILAPEAEAAGTRLAVEPLHPMYADTRSAVSTLGQANDICRVVNHPAVGVAVDVYHLWWDPNLEGEIDRCGANGGLAAFHVCDWKVPTTDMLLDRGLMGEGCIDIPRIRSRVEEAGFQGFIEVEIFSEQYWALDQDDFLAKVVSAYRDYV